MKNKITSFKPQTDKVEDRYNIPEHKKSSDLLDKFSPHGSETKGLTDPNLEMSCYLKEKVNVLERENSILKSEISKNMSIN